MTSLVRLCGVYAVHVGERLPPGRAADEVARRLAAWPAWARAAARASAFVLFWFGPLAVLGRVRRLDRLRPAELEELLARLQRSRSALARGAFLAVKSIVLPVCYGPEAEP